MNETKEDIIQYACDLEDEICRYKEKINKAIEQLKDTNVEMPSTLLIEIIDGTINILKGEDNETIIY